MKIRKLRRINPVSVVLCIALAVAVAVTAGFVALRKSPPEPATESSQPESRIEQSIPSPHPITPEIRAVWIPYMSLDMSNETDRSEDAFRQKATSIVTVAKEKGINTLFVHVRSHSDAIYPSEYFPWSHLLTGTQGEDPGYDPLAIFIDVCHEAGLSFHAWVNPLRVRSYDIPRELSSEGFYTLWQTDQDLTKTRWAIQTDSGIYLNPAYSEVRELIINGVREIVKNYPVDGVHFDDYFYPENNLDFDAQEYDDYLVGLSQSTVPMTQEEWRQTNINLLISGCWSAVHSTNSTALFGISPQASIQNNGAVGADVILWASKSGYVDYLCPQIYFTDDNPDQPFRETAKQWDQMITSPDVSLIFGLGLYKAGSDADDGAWQVSDSIIASQIEFCRTNTRSSGFALYSYQFLTEPTTKKEVEAVQKIIN